MKSQRVAVLGASGMLGSIVLDALERESSLSLVATVRDLKIVDSTKTPMPRVELRRFDAEAASEEEIAEVIQGARWVINCIGVIKPYIKDDNEAQICRAIAVNSAFPHRLSAVAGRCGATVLQIATDCVYSGAAGLYKEDALHDALDVYGKTKSLGEPFLDSVKNIRCSIIGPEPSVYCSLLEWFRRQPEGAALKGFTNHLWNGVTTLHFGRVCKGIIEQELELPRLVHLVPGDIISKAAMLHCFADALGRSDISIGDVAAATAIDRTLATLHPELNRQLWEAAGYASPPTVECMIGEVAAYPYRFAKETA
jgi:dTDP-4-dehydrorhamnose reductase